MKSLLFLSFIIFNFPHFIFAQDFSGILLYELDYVVKREGVGVNWLKKSQGNYMEYYVDNGNYKYVYKYDEKVLFTKSYKRSENKLYVSYPDRDFLVWEDCGRSVPLGSWAIDEKPVEVEGFTTKKILLKGLRGTITYYVSDVFKVDPQSFENHKREHLYEFLTTSEGTLPIKKVIETDDYILTMTLVGLEEKTFRELDWSINESLPKYPDMNEMTVLPQLMKNYDRYYNCINNHISLPKEIKKGVRMTVYFTFIIDRSYANPPPN